MEAHTGLCSAHPSSTLRSPPSLACTGSSRDQWSGTARWSSGPWCMSPSHMIIVWLMVAKLSHSWGNACANMWAQHKLWKLLLSEQSSLQLRNQRLCSWICNFKFHGFVDLTFQGFSKKPLDDFQPKLRSKNTAAALNITWVSMVTFKLCTMYIWYK